MNQKRISKWKTRPSQCLGIAKCLAIPLIACVAFIAFAGAMHGHSFNAKAQLSQVVEGSGAGTAAMAGFGAFGTLLGTDKSRKFYMADKATGGGGTAKGALATIKDKIGELRGRANDSLAKLKPLEQHEGAERMGYLFRSMEDAHERVGDLLNHIETGVLPQFEAAMQSATESAQQAALKDPAFIQGILDQELQSGNLVKKTDVDGRVQTAEQAAYERAKVDLRTESERQTKLITRRAEAITALTPLLKTDKGDGVAQATELCSKLSDETLLADGYKASITQFTERVTQCGKLGVTKVETLQEVCSMEAPAYDKQLATWGDVAKSSSRGPSRGLTPFAVGNGTAAERQSSGEKRKNVIC